MKKKKILKYAKEIAEIERAIQASEDKQAAYENEQKMFKLIDKIFAEDPTAMFEIDEAAKNLLQSS